MRTVSRPVMLRCDDPKTGSERAIDKTAPAVTDSARFGSCSGGGFPGFNCGFPAMDRPRVEGLRTVAPRTAGRQQPTQAGTARLHPDPTWPASAHTDHRLATGPIVAEDCSRPRKSERNARIQPPEGSSGPAPAGRRLFDLRGAAAIFPAAPRADNPRAPRAALRPRRKRPARRGRELPSGASRRLRPSPGPRRSRTW